MSDLGQETPRPQEYFKERIATALKLVDRDINTDETIAIHGTSVEALDLLLRTGKLPGHTEKPDERDFLPQPGDIYFEPFPDFPFRHFPELYKKKVTFEWYETKDQVIRGIGAIAERVAKTHAIQRLLGLPINEDEGHAFSLAFGYPEPDLDTQRALKFYGEKGIDEDKIKEVVEEVKNFGGLLIGLSKDSLNDYPLTPGDAGSDIRIRTGQNGLDLKAVSGIRPLGPEAIKFFASLRK